MSGQGRQDCTPGDWRHRAACRTADARLFDLAEGGERRTYGAVTEQHSRALEHCAACPVREQCLTEAKEHRDSGVRGGVVLEFGRLIGRRAARPAEWSVLLAFHAELMRCKKAGETPSAECVAGERAYQAEAYRRRRVSRGVA